MTRACPPIKSTRTHLLDGAALALGVEALARAPRAVGARQRPHLHCVRGQRVWGLVVPGTRGLCSAQGTWGLVPRSPIASKQQPASLQRCGSPWAGFNNTPTAYKSNLHHGNNCKLQLIICTLPPPHTCLTTGRLLTQAVTWPRLRSSLLGGMWSPITAPARVPVCVQELCSC